MKWKKGTSLWLADYCTTEPMLLFTSASCLWLQPEFANDGYTNYFVHKPIFAQNDSQAVSISSLSNWQVWYIWQMVATFCAIPEWLTGGSLSTMIVHSVLQLASGFKLLRVYYFFLVFCISCFDYFHSEKKLLITNCFCSADSLEGDEKPEQSG